MRSTLATGPKSREQLCAEGLSGQDLSYNVTELVNELRREVEVWRNLPNPSQWQVSPVTQRLLSHWRAIQKDEKQVIRPFFCQLEAVETAIWLGEVAPKLRDRGRRFKTRLEAANAEANPICEADKWVECKYDEVHPDPTSGAPADQAP